MSEIETPQITKTSRDHAVLKDQFETWLRARLGVAADAQVVSFEAPESNGMSSETILVTATWNDSGARSDHDLVVRLAPPTDSMPVFPRYDLTEQYEVMATVAELTDVPVPALLWNEPSAEPLGAPFLVMARSIGEVPPDVMPYTFGGWVADLSGEERDQFERSTVQILVNLAAIENPAAAFPRLAPAADDQRSPLRRHVDAARAWLDWSVGDQPSPLLDRCFEWLDANWPANDSDEVLSWGDARIGNVMYDGLDPVAVFDWEMATLGPRELDLAWLIFLHRFFDDIATQMEMPGIPDLLDRDRIEALYAELSGYTPQDLDWYIMYSATRHGIVFSRISRRMAHFGDQEMPADPDDAIMHRSTLEAMLDGSYWNR